MKRFSIAASAILLTCGLAFFAIAVAQRDSRNQLAIGLEQRPDYADQAMIPIRTQLPETVPTPEPTPGKRNPFEVDNSNSDNKLRPTLHEISSIRDGIQEGMNESRSQSSFTEPSPINRIAEPPRIIQDISQSGEELESLQEIAKSDDNSAFGFPPSSEAVESQVDLASAMESTNGFEEGAVRQPGATNIQPLPPSKLIAPPPMGQQGTSSGPPTATLMPPSLSSPFSNTNQTGPNQPSSSVGTPPTFSAEGNTSPSFSVPNLSAPTNKQNVAPNLMPPSMTNPLPASPPSLQSNGQNFEKSQGPNRGEDQGQLQGQVKGQDLRGSASSSSRPESTGSSFGKSNSSWPNSSIQNLPPSTNHGTKYSNAGAGVVNAVPERSSQHEASSFNQRALPPDALLASNAPGTRQLDGSQNPSLQIHKRAPEEVQVGHPATFTLLVRNVGTATAYEVTVTDSVPKGTKLSKTNPPAQARPDGALVWSLGEMSAGSEQVLTAEIIPETEGEIGSVASVTFAAQASVRTVSTQPKLVIKQTATDKVLLGQPVKIQITVSNEGSGVARGVSLEEDVPPGLRHPLGATLGVPLGDLVPGQSRTTQLELIGVEPGVVQNYLRAVSSNSATAESSVPVEVVAPVLKLTAGGPKLRYLERQATYQISVTNTGTSMAHNVELFAYLPRGMQFNSAVNEGEYLSDQHAVTWGLEELAVGATATTEMTLLPVEEGDYVIRLQGRGDGVRSEPFEKPLRIEGQSELAFSIEDDNDPIETDEKTTYSIRLTNNGTRVDQDVSLMVELPPGAKVLQVNAPVAYNVTREGILFEPLAQVKAKDQQTYRFSVELTQEGTQVVRAHVKSKLRPLAIVKEESTQVYRDQ